MSFVKVQGVVLSARNLNDSDKIITLLSDKYGKIDIVANGCRRPKSRFMSSTQMFCYGEYVITTGKNLYTLKESSIIESFQGLILDLDTLSYGSYFLELIDSLVEKDMKNVHLLALTLKTLYILLHSKGNLPLLKLIFEFKAISLAGYMPEVFKCVNCNTREGYFVFSSSLGGLVCRGCNTLDEIELKKDEIKLLQDIRNIKLEDIQKLSPSREVLQNVSSIITFYIHNHIEKEFKSLQLIKILS
ncbi:MAG: DNA repair protein RecO [Clostridium sp.]|uniref:DNA repair protein RecO n=1 Tax=Clostridium sp. TaxID=1506 RepID=UPI002FCB366A